MPERIIEIIVYALRKFQEDRNKKDFLDLTSELVAKGYTESEINLSFSWIYDHLKKSNSTSTYIDESDLLNEFEPEDELNPVLSDEAYGYLMQMIHLGILNEFQVDQILEKALTSGLEDINTEQVKSYIVNILFDSEKFNPAYSSYYFHRGNQHIQ